MPAAARSPAAPSSTPRGAFLVTTSLDRSVFRGGDTVRAGVRAVDYLGAPRAGVPRGVVLQRRGCREGRYSGARVAVATTTTATTDGDGRATAEVALPVGVSGSFRLTVTAPAGDREVSDQAWLWVPGREDAGIDEGDRYLELLADRRTYQPGDVARLAVRGETIDGPVLVTKEGQHVSWHRVVRPSADAPIEVPIEDGDIGDVYVNLLYLRDGRLFRAERRSACRRRHGRCAWRSRRSATFRSPVSRGRSRCGSRTRRAGRCGRN